MTCPFLDGGRIFAESGKISEGGGRLQSWAGSQVCTPNAKGLTEVKNLMQADLHLVRFRCMHAQSFSRVQLSVTPWTVAHQAPLSMGFSRQEYGSGWPFPSLGDLPDPRNLPDPGIKPRSPALQVDSLPSEPSGKPHYLSTSSKPPNSCYLR